jgi:hypothetical protein
MRDVELDASTPALKLPIDFSEASNSNELVPQTPLGLRSRAPERSASRAAEPQKEQDSQPASDASSNADLGAAMRQSVGLPSRVPTEDKPLATGGGYLNIVTTPSAVVLLDGRPVGKTPTRVRVSAGVHSLVLIHGSERKRASITVDSGANKTIKATF